MSDPDQGCSSSVPDPDPFFLEGRIRIKSNSTRDRDSDLKVYCITLALTVYNNPDLAIKQVLHLYFQFITDSCSK